MRTRSGRQLSWVVATCLILTLAGCSAGTSPSATASPGPTAAPPTTPGPSASPSGAAFTLDVQPTAMTGRTLIGSKVVFLVTVSGKTADGPVTITAAAPETTVTVAPKALAPGTVGEVTVAWNGSPSAQDEIETELSVCAHRAGVSREEKRTLTLSVEEDGLHDEAVAHLAPFLTWLAAHRPELGLTPQTALQATPGSWVLVVDHYLFFSEKWEIDLSWHVMIAPHDWSRIALRERWVEVAPSLAFEIASVSGGAEPQEIEPPEAVWR